MVSFLTFHLSRSLQVFRVSGTNFAGAFPHSIGNLSNLSELDLSNCGFNGKINKTQFINANKSESNFFP